MSKQFPAIHPRYQAAYLSLYGEEKDEDTKRPSSFMVRFIISILILAVFYIMDYRNEKIATVDSQYIINEVQSDLLGENFPFFIK